MMDNTTNKGISKMCSQPTSNRHTISFADFVAEVEAKLNNLFTLREAVDELEDRCINTRVQTFSSKLSNVQDGTAGSALLELVEDGDSASLIAASMKSDEESSPRWEICITRHFGFSVGQLQTVLHYPLGLRTWFLKNTISPEFPLEDTTSFFEYVRSSQWFKRLRDVVPTYSSVTWVSGEDFSKQINQVDPDKIRKFLNFVYNSGQNRGRQEGGAIH